MRISKSSLVVGVLLILAGLTLVVVQLFGVDLDLMGWPLFVIIPGVLLLIFAVGLGGSAGEGLSVVGAMVTVVGLILFYQDRTGHWATWAYAWALVAPGSIGLGQIIFGLVHGKRELIRSGTDTLIAGLQERGQIITSPIQHPRERSGIVCFRHPTIPSDVIAGQLHDVDVIVSVRGDGIRVSPHFYNNEADLERLLTALPS